MENYDFAKISKKLSKYMDEDRFQHTLGVTFTCASLAMAFGCNIEQAQIAGLMHDSAKCIPNKKKIKICKDNKIPISDFELENPFLLHAKLGAYIAEKKYGIHDAEVLSAICCHTTGKAAMTPLEKIVYIADYIEPMRNKAPNLEKIRRRAFEDLDECIYIILKDTLSYLEVGTKKIDPETEKAYHYYAQIHMDRFGKEIYE